MRYYEIAETNNDTQSDTDAVDVPKQIERTRPDSTADDDEPRLAKMLARKKAKPSDTL